MPTFFYRGQLIFKVDRRRTGFDHRFHQFKRVKHATKSGFGICHDRQEVVDKTRIIRLNA
ncbi:hypothetical protein D3C81_2123290 [compost metagenome]